MTVLIGVRQYTVEGKRPLPIGDYKVRFSEKYHQRSLEFLLPNGGEGKYLVTEEAEAP